MATPTTKQTANTYLVVRTNFHARYDLRRPAGSPYAPSADVVSRHTTLELARRAERKLRNPNCKCGCVLVVPVACGGCGKWNCAECAVVAAEYRSAGE